MADSDIAIGDRGVLTAREAEAVLWVAQGKTGWEAGRILGVTEHTLSAHVANASRKLAATNRAHLVARAFVHGVLVVAARNGVAGIMLLLCALGFHTESLRRAPRPPRRRDEVEMVIVAGA